MDKVRKKKKEKSKSSVITPFAAKPTVSQQNLLDSEEPSGSVISVREADTDDRKDYTDEGGHRNEGMEDEVPSRPSSARPPSARPASSRPASARPPAGTSRPPSAVRINTLVEAERPASAASVSSSARKNAAQSQGSMASLRSKEAWGAEQVPDRPETALSKYSGKQIKDVPDELSVSSVLGPAELNAAHAYVPYLYARECIARIMEDMKKMKSYHLSIVHDIENNYTSIEEQTQNQFNLFVLGLRDQYGKKVTTFRQVIEVHRIELQQKQQYWDEVLASFSSRNQKLLVDKKTLLVQNKVEIERLEKEKEEAIQSFTFQLDNQTKSVTAMKNEQSHEIEEIQKKVKSLQDQLDTEKEEKLRLETEVEELRNRPPPAAVIALSSHDTQSSPGGVVVLAAGDSEEEKHDVGKDDPELKSKSSKIKGSKKGDKVVATEARPASSRPTSRQPAVIVKDMTEEDRKRMDDERRMMDIERDKMRQEREEFEKERSQFSEERKRFQEERVILQGDLNTLNKDKETWKAKYESLHDQLGELADLRAKYLVLEAQLAAAAAMATVASDEDKKKADSKIEKAGDDKAIMEEEQVSLKQDLEKWEKTFEEEKGRKPTEDDKPDSVKELETSLGESQQMVDKLNAQIAALESLKQGEVPTPPPLPVAPITIKETEVKIVEVKVPDPEVVAMMEMTQSELEATRRQLQAVKKDKVEMQGELTNIQGEVADATWQLEKTTAAQEEVEKQLDTAQDEIDELRAQLAVQAQDGTAAVVAAPVGADPELVAELERLLKEKDRELEAQSYSHKEAVDQLQLDHVKAKHDMERDIKKLLKEIAKLKKKLQDKPVGDQPPEEVQLEKAEDHADKLENNILDLEAKVSNLEADNKAISSQNTDMKQRLAALETTMNESEVKLAALTSAAGAAAALVDAQQQVEDLRDRVKELEGDVLDLEQQMRDLERNHAKQTQEKDKVIKDMENDMRKLLKQMDKLKKKLAALESKAVEGEEGADIVPSADKDLEGKISELEDQVVDLETDRDHLKETNTGLEKRIEELEVNLASSEDQVAVLAVAAEAEEDLGKAQDDLEDLRRKIKEQEENLREKDNEVRSKERELRDKETEFVEKERDYEEKIREKEKFVADMEKDMKKLLREIAKLRKKLAQAKGEESAPESSSDEMERLEKEIDKMEAKAAETEKALIDLRGDRDKAQKDSKAKTEQHNKITRDRDRLEAQLNEERAAHEITRQELDTYRAQVTALKKDVKAASGKGALAVVPAPRAARVDKGRGAAGNDKAVKDLQDKLRDAKNENRELQTRIKQLENEARQSGGKGGDSSEIARTLKKQEKLVKELEKLLDNERKKSKKNEDNFKQQQEENKQLSKETHEKEEEIKRLKGEMSLLGVAAKEGLELGKKVKSQEKDIKKLQEENKTLTENFNSERVLRKKYYNMVEDMKGKIRVYCRVRPMSKSEVDRGNVSAVKSPDEYSINVDTQRGTKEFQFDTIFMPESSQDKVFEDTNNLIQSAVDGYNVCIFAYGQTGSGKTFTIIGDSKGQYPGIAPRAFDRIFDLLDENKSKFSYKVSCYMIELYNDRLLDLFSKGGQSHTDDEKLEVKKDKKGMVVVQGAEVKMARNSKELFGLFEEGSKTRHTASTKMNSESSRSHLVIGIIIETTNKISGQIMKGKLSLVDLAGSERAAKTDASAEQLKEAMSINKSLSALGDVISALSSEQQFIPYRNNKLTMLMQDSLGGNAKTLMFVNISPADYNCDESAISLTYASRVKLITNDAQKNSDNKEISRLKQIINKMKKGETVEEETD